MFWGLGLAAYLQFRQSGDFALKKQLPWLAAFGFVSGITSWVDMFLVGGSVDEYLIVLKVLRVVAQPLSGLLLLIFGWHILKDLTPLPTWAIFILGILIVPISYVFAYAATTFITPSPIEIPIDIWSRYLLYLPGSIMAGIGFLRQAHAQRKQGLIDISGLMLATGLAFLFEAFVLGLIVPAAPYGPASYYNYDRVISNAFIGEHIGGVPSYGLMTPWLDYQKVLEVTGMPIQFWRLLSTLTLTIFMVRGLGVFDALRKRQLVFLEMERDRAQKAAIESQIAARQIAENWAEVLVSINRKITELEDVDGILLYIIENARNLLNSDFAGLGLLQDDYSSLELKCYSNGQQTELLAAPTPIQSALILNALQSTRSFRSAGEEVLADLSQAGLFSHDKMEAVAVVSFALDHRPIGGIWIARKEAKAYSDVDLIWLEYMADQVVIALQHGLMTSQLQSLSITEERSRIAREMHDGLAQVLGYLNLQVQTLGALLKQDRRADLETELGQMRQAISVANADVRENILSLRTTLASEKGLASAIDEYLQEFGIQTGIETEFINKIEGNLNLASVAEVQLVCILQEALANVRKHAQATHVKVLIDYKNEQQTDYIHMSVLDDGIGFAAQGSKRSFGLETMRERASSVQGCVTVHSFPGAGTRVECALPCLPQEKLPNNPSWLAAKPDTFPTN